MDETIVNGFVKSAWHLLVYAPYCKVNNNCENFTEKVLFLIDNEVGWNRRLDKLNADNMGLTGFAGIGLGLISEVTLANT